MGLIDPQLASMICFIFIPFFANNVETLLVGEILQGCVGPQQRS